MGPGLVKGDKIIWWRSLKKELKTVYSIEYQVSSTEKKIQEVKKRYKNSIYYIDKNKIVFMIAVDNLQKAY